MARPSKPIKWDEVILRMKAGNSAQSIANSFDIPISTFYQRFIDEFDCSFQDKKSEMLESGSDDILMMQMKKALGGSERMLLWLGQVKCGQKAPETTSATYNLDDKQKLEAIHNQLSTMSEALNNSRTNNNNET